MSHPNPTSPAVRKIRAKLRNYTRPFVWGSVLILGLLTLLIWDFSNNPERFYLLSLEDEEESEVGNEPEGWIGMSPEDSAIAADIDSSSVLINELKQMQPPPQIQLPTPRNSNRRSSASTRSQPIPIPSSTNRALEGEQNANQNWEDLYKLPELSILPPSDDAATESEKLPSVSILGVPTPPENSNGTPPSPGNRLGIYSGGVSNFETPDLTRLPVSPLQSAMDRLYSPNNSTSGDRNPDNPEASQGPDATPQRESNRGSSGENRPNPTANPGNTGSQTSPNSSGNAPQPAQTPNRTPQNGANPYANPISPGPNNPYGTPLTSPSPYGNTPQPAQMPNGTPETRPNSYPPITPRLPGEISPNYTVDYSEDDKNPNNYQPLPATPLVPNSNPTNAYDYLLRSGGQPVPLAPTAPTAAPQTPNNLGTATDLTPNSSIYQPPSNQPVGNSPSVVPGVQPLNQPSDRPSPSPLNQPSNVPTYQPVNPPSVQSPQVDNSGLNLNRETPGVQPIQPIQPFSVPNSIPGRNIGGGNINTFSNP
ncbi:hypothetical protein J0895_13955 [Phormidium pseudopriestleyi FRX01]|uniref:Uncharacterized protein n=1 Tax=Phormidium pseudopriestleyi FRX01 TaxID=1759528 RepID=A0ABS3FSW4_9CYAN|nr:hypothetical protein [Phormidium pseudopriestleyi]MBO0350196.1 hypothetical protein [Phormidium pseudopriestleyi FRX01]